MHGGRNSTSSGTGSHSCSHPPTCLSSTCPLTPPARGRMAPVMLAAVQWGPQSQSLSITEKPVGPGRRVCCHCDNQVVVDCLHSRMTKNEGLMHLLRCLLFVEAQHQCHLVAEYIDTKSNHLADNLSCNRASPFLFKVPEADHRSLLLLSLLLDRQANWTSPTWRRQFGNISRRV